MGKGVQPVVGGKIIGRPYQGTHARDFNAKGGSDNWESENAVDIAVPVGTPVYASANGTIGSQFGSQGKGGRFAGLRLHLDNANEHFYYAHLSRFAPGIKPGVSVHAGQIIGYSGEANGVAHLHFATQSVNPLSYVKGVKPTATGASYTDTTGTTPDSTGVVDTSGGTTDELAADIGNIPQVGGAPLSSPPLLGQTMDDVLPQQQTASTWQLIATNGSVSPDTLRLAQMAQLGSNGGTSSG